MLSIIAKANFCSHYCLHFLSSYSEPRFSTAVEKSSMNTVQIMCTHVCKCKIIPSETVPGMQGEMKERGGGGEFKYDIFDLL
jgi:hypothetical protein